MKEARAEILGKLRSTNSAENLPLPELRPSYAFMRGLPAGEELVRLFVSRAEKAGARVLCAEHMREIPMVLNAVWQPTRKAGNHRARQSSRTPGGEILPVSAAFSPAVQAAEATRKTGTTGTTGTTEATGTIEAKHSVNEANGATNRERMKDMKGREDITDASGIATLPWKDARYALSPYERTGNIPRAVGFAFAGLAETGSLAVGSSPVSPAGLYFLADSLCVLLRRGSIFPMAEDLIRAGLPRSSVIHLITGPSRTADIEQTTEIGAHGPRELVIVLFGKRDS